MPNSITLACVMGGLCAAGFTAFEWADKGSGITHAFLLGACQPFVLLPVYNAIRRQRFTQCILISGVNLFLTASFIFTFGSSTVPILTLFLITIWFGKRLEHLE